VNNKRHLICFFVLPRKEANDENEEGEQRFIVVDAKTSAIVHIGEHRYIVGVACNDNNVE
jgi:hypothetical protein